MEDFVGALGFGSLNNFFGLLLTCASIGLHFQMEYYKQTKDILDGDDTLMECDGANGSSETPVVPGMGDHSVCLCLCVCGSGLCPWWLAVTNVASTS